MVLISGAGSFLSKAVVPKVEKIYNVFSFGFEDGDLNDHKFISSLVKKYSPQIFINLSEYPNIYDAEYFPEFAYKQNAKAVKNIAKICKDNNLLLIHFSSSYIFSGNKETSYNENDIPDPISAYGDSKLLGEKYILESGCRNLILRISDLYGPGSPIFNLPFIKKNNHTIDVIKGHVISPSLSTVIADCFIQLLNKNVEGIFHLSQNGHIDSAGFIRTALEVYNNNHHESEYSVWELGKKDFISPIDIPIYNVLDNSKYINYTGFELRDWKIVLEEFIIENIKSINF